MGAKTWMLVTSETGARNAFASKPGIDRGASLQFAQRLFPGEVLTPLKDGNLYDTSPPDDELYVACFNDTNVLLAREFGIDHPSQMPTRFIANSGATTLHAMHSGVNWFAYAHWVDGKLIRGLSLSPDDGIIEDIGDPHEFEKPYWSGEHPAVEEGEDDYPFAFDPLDLGEAALLYFFGFQIEGYESENAFDPEGVPLLHFKRSTANGTKKWWKPW